MASAGRQPPTAWPAVLDRLDGEYDRAMAISAAATE